MKNDKQNLKIICGQTCLCKSQTDCMFTHHTPDKATLLNTNQSPLSNETKVVESVEQAVNIYFCNLISAQGVMDMYPDMAFLEGAKFGVNWQFKNTDAVKVIKNEIVKLELQVQFYETEYQIKILNHILKLIQP